MPLFARRRLQAMLDDLGPRLGPSKVKDLLARLEKKQIEQALPAEMELGLLWAVGRLGPCEIEPDWCLPSRRPEALTDALFPGHSTLVEVVALSDAALPGDEGMQNAAAKLSHAASRIRKGAGRRLCYYFFEESGWKEGKYFRRVRVPRSLELDAEVERILRAWLQPDEPSSGAELHLTTPMIDVKITWNEQVQHHRPYWSSMPPEVHDLRDNYLWRALDRKADQLRGDFDGLRCVFVGDVGSTLLRELTRRDWTGRFVCGAEIIAEWLKQPKPGIDVIVAFSPNRFRPLSGFRDELRWSVTRFDRPGLVGVNTHRLEALARELPKPRFEGYQARSLHEQGLYAPTARPWHLGTTIISRTGSMQIKVSSRLLLSVLAGREPASRLFDRDAAETVLSRQLQLGRTIHEITIEPQGPDEDDDLVVITFDDDPAAQRLRPPSKVGGAETERS